MILVRFPLNKTSINNMGLWTKGIKRSQTDICRLQDVVRKVHVRAYEEYTISIDDERHSIEVYQGDIHVGYYICDIYKLNMFERTNIISSWSYETKYKNLMYSPNFIAAVILTVREDM